MASPPGGVFASINRQTRHEEPPLLSSNSGPRGKSERICMGAGGTAEGGQRDRDQPRSVDVPLMARNTWREFCSSERIISSW